MTRYEQAIERVNQLLGEEPLAEEVSPQVQTLLNQKIQLQKRIDALDAQRKPLIIQMSQLNTRLTQQGQDVNV